MLKKMCAITSVCLIWASVASAGDTLPPTKHPDSSKWQDLFASDLSDAIFLGLDKNLHGVVSNKAGWTFKNGLLAAQNGQILLTKEKYSNYVLDLEFKNAPGANSGVFIYCSDLVNWIPNKLEIQILDDYAACWAKEPKTAQCGAAYRRMAPSKQTVKKAGEWNRMTLWCIGPKIYEMINGALILQIDRTQWTSPTKSPTGVDIPSHYNIPLAAFPAKGHIGLQGIHGGAVTFRNVKINFIESTKP